jgi:hypothetical protein
MADLLAPLQRLMSARLVTAGFRLTDWVTDADWAWLEYRATDRGEAVLFGLFHMPSERTIVAELWRPTRLAAAIHRGTLMDAVQHHQIWQYEPGTDIWEIGGRVAPILVAWFSETPVSGPA